VNIFVSLLFELVLINSGGGQARSGNITGTRRVLVRHHPFGGCAATAKKLPAIAGMRFRHDRTSAGKTRTQCKAPA
jgi:hypothetical protein